MPRPVSLVAERAVRLLRRSSRPIDSVTMAREVLSTKAPNEESARRILEAAFSGDPRLQYASPGWKLAGAVAAKPNGDPPVVPEPDRALLLVDGGQPDPGEPWTLSSVAALRLRDDEVVAACGGDVVEGPGARRLRRSILEMLDGAVPVIHDPPGSIRALETWLEEPLAAPISLRRLAVDRLSLPARHTLEQLAEQLDLDWRETGDPLEMADLLDACLRKLTRPGERLYGIRVEQSRGVKPLDWSRYAFNREFLRRVPRVPGTYRFVDAEGNLLYVGKSKNLNQRLHSYFRETGRRTPRVQKLVERVHRIEYEASGSDLEAMLREAEKIRAEKPQGNTQREIHPRPGRARRLRSILILEPAEPPTVLRAYMIREGRLLARIGIGPRGGGLTRVRRLLDDHYFSAPSGPTPATGAGVDVEIVVRWLAANRDRVVAFDPTELRSSDEVIERLKWFLARGGPFDSDGSPILAR